MGGQACVLYGAAEFSRDTDLAIVPDRDNLAALRNALHELQAQNIAVPPFESDYLERGHAVHFRCFAPDAHKIRVDLMAVMRGVAPFDELWARRTSVEIEEETFDLLALPDLVVAKKTQRDKDWPMIRRLLEVHYLEFRGEPTAERIAFWLRELRTPSLLLEAAAAFPGQLEELRPARAVLGELSQSEIAIEAALRDEEERERALDRAYWRPLKAELESLRHARRAPEKT